MDSISTTVHLSWETDSVVLSQIKLHEPASKLEEVERDGVNDGSNLFLNYPNLPFNLRDVLVSTRQVKLRRPIHRPHPSFKRSKFPVAFNENNLKTLLKVITAHAFQCIKNGESLPIAQVRNQQKAYDQTVGNEEWYLVDEKMSIAKVTSLCSSQIYFGILMTSCLTTGGVVLTIFPFNSLSAMDGSDRPLKN